jgi:hypothetical protein
MTGTLVALAAFVCGFALDWVWTKCVDSVQTRRPGAPAEWVAAANMSVLIYLCALVSTVLIVEKAVLACAAYALGGWLGTYAVVKRKA